MIHRRTDEDAVRTLHEGHQLDDLTLFLVVSVGVVEGYVRRSEVDKLGFRARRLGPVKRDLQRLPRVTALPTTATDGNDQRPFHRYGLCDGLSYA